MKEDAADTLILEPSQSPFVPPPLYIRTYSIMEARFVQLAAWLP